jgi:hypothetical protein
MATTPYKLATLQWPINAEQWQALADMLEDIYQRLREGSSSAVSTTAAIAAAAENLNASNLTSGTLPEAQMPALTGAVTSYAGTVETTLTAGVDAAKINTGVVSNTEFNYLDGVTSAIQTQFDARLNIAQTMARIVLGT